MRIIKKYFFKSKKSNLDQKKTLDPMLFLLYEIAKSDGVIDDVENEIILDLIKKNISKDQSEKSVLQLLSIESENSSSLYPSIKIINESFNLEEKLNLLSLFWKMISSDGQIKPEEESLYFKIAELIRVKRVVANKIKYGYS
jgi:uncharacterized tellurite resistance protein B-like protein